MARSAALAALLIALIGFLGTAPAQGAYSNYNSVLLGERAAGMGGAFTALTGDAAATPFYNPASTVLMSGSSLSATVNVYNKYETNFGSQSDFRDASQKLNRGFFRSLPASSATVLHFKSFAVGLSILVPDYEFYSGKVKDTATTSTFLSTVDESLWVGGTFSAKLTEIDSAGFSLYYTARNLSRSVSDRIETGGASGAVLTNEEKNLTTNSVAAILGYHRSLSPTWSFGVSYRPPSLPIAGDATYYRSVTVTSPYSSTVTNRGNLRALTRIPAKLAVGLARELKGLNTVSFDLQFYEGQAYHDLPELATGSEDIKIRSLFNFSLGYEQVMREWLKLRLGAFSNYSSHPDPDLTSGFRQGDHIDMSGFSANMNIKTPEGTWLTIGGYYSAGHGQSTQIVAGDLVLVPKSQQVFTMVVASGFAF